MAEQITVYGADWCGDTVRTLRHLERKGAEYDYVDIDKDREGERKVIDFHKGKRRIPLVEIATEKGTRALSVPSDAELDRAMSE
jgi:glutaredoxin